MLHLEVTRHQLETRDTYNMDEKGFLIGIAGRSKRVFSRRMWQKDVMTSLWGGSLEWIMLLACECAHGSVLLPSLIYQAAAGFIQSGGVEGIQAG